MNPKLILPTLALVTASALPLSAETFHVSKSELHGIKNELQFRNIANAAQRAQAGDTVIIHAGIYRESLTVSASGTAAKPITFKNAPGELVEISGADVLDSWVDADNDPGTNIYVADWTPFTDTDSRLYYPSDDYHKLIGRNERVSVNELQLKQVLRKDRLERGTFFADNDNRKLYFWAPSNRVLLDKTGKSDAKFDVKAARRTVLWHNTGDHIHLKGLRFRESAGHALAGSLQINGKSNLIEDCVFEDNNACGIDFKGANAIARRCTFQNNGHFGFIVFRAHDSLLTDCVIRENGWKGHKLGWGAGGNKILFTRNFTIENTLVEGNRGNGIWYDIGNVDNTVRNCLIIDNQAAGIFYEISYSLHAHDNVIMHNGLGADYTAWGAAAGIALSSSPDCLIERNILLGNKEGFALREQFRKTGLIEHWDIDGYDIWSKTKDVAIWNQNHILRHNIITKNRDAQVWGWFTIGDKRHLPSDRPSTVTFNEEGHPQGMALHDLNLDFHENLYGNSLARTPLYRWGPSWDPQSATFQSIEETQQALGLETKSQTIDLPFQNLDSLDLRLPAESFPSDSYPHGSVPGVTLGKLPQGNR